ncbi:YbaB/EbfC family nucleoid-associated protein [Levilactobacillus namurensis]|uniref:YbaB/EbfC family nucleoid-associated protein n=1 Tax=Levilactobacillus namurensis TaxID=380393 RepID=UPI0004677343|nr:YbaB/EbfC family nucleoid-associated protein [Levilactobacillus namurensis]HJE46122.1 YbaB/EbfC family nucleoid-associated protein [Levilactobacillus namurensis]
MRGMGNMGNMMKQMRQMQKKMEADQAALNAQTFTGASPDDLVKATFTGDRKMTDLTIKPEAIDPDDPDMLADLVLAAVNAALTEVDETTKKSLGKYTQGMNIPGL